MSHHILSFDLLEHSFRIDFIFNIVNRSCLRKLVLQVLVGVYLTLSLYLLLLYNQRYDSGGIRFLGVELA